MNKNSYVWVWCEGEDEYKAESFALDMAKAVERWARNRDFRTNEFGVARGEEVVVLARIRGGTTRRFRVSAQQEIVYSATEIE